MTGDCSVVKFLLRCANGKRLMRFHSEATAFKFLPRVWTEPQNDLQVSL